jgi:hypothetical protein
MPSDLGFIETVPSDPDPDPDWTPIFCATGAAENWVPGSGSGILIKAGQNGPRKEKNKMFQILRSL